MAVALNIRSFAVVLALNVQLSVFKVGELKGRDTWDVRV